MYPHDYSQISRGCGCRYTYVGWYWWPAAKQGWRLAGYLRHIPFGQGCPWQGQGVGLFYTHGRA